MRKIIKAIFYIVKHPCRFFRTLLYKVRMANVGLNSIIEEPLKIDGHKNISIGRSVKIQKGTWLACLPLTGQKSCRLVIHDGVVIGHFNHIYSTCSIIIHENVLIADKVYITDNVHGYYDIDVPIRMQPIIQKPVVEIGEGSWIGENVCIIGANVGKHCVIGANSVVTHDIPDYSVAVGVPAKVIKQYNNKSKEWIKVY